MGAMSFVQVTWPLAIVAITMKKLKVKRDLIEMGF
jgi:hypothetical protein